MHTPVELMIRTPRVLPLLTVGAVATTSDGADPNPLANLQAGNTLADLNDNADRFMTAVTLL